MHRIVFAMCMSLVLSSLMTAWVTWINLGWSEVFSQQWGHAFISSWPVVAIISFLVAPEIHKIATLIVLKIDRGNNHD